MKICNLVNTRKLKGEIVAALKGVNFDLSDTGMMFIFGKSGSGESTLLNLMGGVDAAMQIAEDVKINM